MKKFNNLYCLDKKGKIRIFKARVEKVNDEGEHDGVLGVSNDSEVWTIITETGLVGGKLTPKAKQITKGKNIGKANETTVEEQAILEARSKWESKFDEGYKSDEMVNLMYGCTFKEAVEKELIKHNTHKDWTPLPMLAEPYKKVKGIQFPVFAQPKLNGVRCTAIKKDGKIILKSRGGLNYLIPHIEEQLHHLFQYSSTAVFDGEIYKHGVPLQEIVGAVREEAGKVDKTWLEYHLYDTVDDMLRQSTRMGFLKSIKDSSNRLDSIPNIDFVKTLMCTSEEHVKELHDKAIAKGYEGLILRPLDGKYKIGFRDKALIKVKEFFDEEFTLIGCKVSEGQSVGDSFVFELRNNTNDLTFYARPRGTREMKEAWYNNQNWINKPATVRYQERTEDDLPHQAHVVVIRDYE